MIYDFGFTIYDWIYDLRLDFRFTILDFDLRFWISIYDFGFRFTILDFDLRLDFGFTIYDLGFTISGVSGGF
jgi:hypothetical protein